MGTSNFYNHDNGIFVVGSTGYEQMKEWMLEDEVFEDVREGGLTDEAVYEQMDFENEREFEEFFEEGCYFEDNLRLNGYELQKTNNYKAMVYNKKDKIVAELSLKSGYYDGVQLIVETNPYEIVELEQNTDLYYNDRVEDYQDEFVKSKLYEEYTPYNKTLLKIIENCTNKLEVYAQFSNGETMYI